VAAVARGYGLLPWLVARGIKALGTTGHFLAFEKSAVRRKNPKAIADRRGDGCAESVIFVFNKEAKGRNMLTIFDSRITTPEGTA